MKDMKNNPGTSMKCRFSNQVHRILEPNIDVKRSQRWKKEYREKYTFTDEEKLRMFDEIAQLHKELSSELSSYLYDRRKKRRIQKLRNERGYVPKKKTSLEEYRLKAS